MDNEHVRELSKTDPLAGIHLFIAALAVVARHYVRLDEGFQGVINILFMFDGDRQVIELIFPLRYMVAVLALYQLSHFPSEDIVY